MRPRDLAVACAAALLAIVAIVLACTAATTQGCVRTQPAYACCRYSVEVELCDVGTSQ